MHRTTINLPEDLKARATEYARQCGSSLSEVIRESLESWLKSKNQRSPRDPLFDNIQVYGGAVPNDYSINHDKYLSGQ